MEANPILEQSRPAYLPPLCESCAMDAGSIVCVSGKDGSTEEWDEVDWSNY